MPVKKNTPKTKKTTSASRTKVSAMPKEEPVSIPMGNKPPAFLTTIRKPKVFVPVAVIVMLLLFIYIFRSWFVVALVNGQPITRAAFEKQLEATSGKQVLNNLIVQTLIEQEASKRHVTVSQQEVDAAVKQVSDQLAQQGQSLDSALAARGMTRQDFTDQVRVQKLIEKMLANQIAVSDKEVQDYITQNASTFPQNMSDADKQKEAKNQLEQQKLSDKASAFIQQLQSKAKITQFITL